MFRTILIALTLSAVARADFSGKVEFNNDGVADATVELWTSGTTAQPQKIGSAASDDDGGFRISDATIPANGVHYFVARFKTTRASVALLCIPGRGSGNVVTINELTTVASAFTSAQFFDGSNLSGSSIGLQVASENTANLVNPATGRWGQVLLNPLNSTQNTTLVKLNTLAALLTAFGTQESDQWRHDFRRARLL